MYDGSTLNVFSPTMMLTISVVITVFARGRFPDTDERDVLSERALGESIEANGEAADEDEANNEDEDGANNEAVYEAGDEADESEMEGSFSNSASFCLWASKARLPSSSLKNNRTHNSKSFS